MSKDNVFDKTALLAGNDVTGLAKYLQVDSSGRLVVALAGGVGALCQVLHFRVTGTLTTGAKALKLYNLTGVALTIRKVHLSVDTAPTGAALICDIHMNGSTIFAAESRPQVAAGYTSGSSVTFYASSMADGAYMTLEIDQVGSSVAGADLVASVVLG